MAARNDNAFSITIVTSWWSGQKLAVNPDGTVRWLRDQGEVSAHGTTMTGACVDVTDHRKAEEALRQCTMTNLHVLDGGMNAWEDSGAPMRS